MEFVDDYRFQSLLMLDVDLGSLGIPVIFALLRSRHNVTVVGVKSPGKPFTYATEKTVVSNHDLIIVSGTEGDIEKFAALE